MTKRQRGFTQFTRPVFPSLWPPDGTAALGHFLGLRTPRLPATHAEAGTVLAHWTGRYVSGISRTSFDESHCLRATFVSHDLIDPRAVGRGEVHVEPGMRRRRRSPMSS